MSEGLALSGAGFIERSRFRSDFDQTSYITRTASPTPRVLQDISARGYSSLAQDREHNLTKQKLAKLVLSKVTIKTEKITKSEVTTSKLKVNQKDRSSHAVKIFGRKGKLQAFTTALAVLLVLAGAYVTYTTWVADKSVKTEATKLTTEANKAANSGNSASTSPAISTVKPTPKAVAAYVVAPNLPKYLKIPAIGVNTRVMQVGILASGALGTPSNVYDTAWYTGSAEPGKPGATLIDGHVSSWTAHGVFYNLHALKAGDSIQIVKGDNSVVNYQVVKTQTYSSNNVDMQAAITPVDPSVSGLNLITCTGQVIKGTSQFNQRVIVFAKQV